MPISGDLRHERRRYELHRGDHVARYRWVASRIRDARVLDVGCGHGFGALFLGAAARSYRGIDVDRGAIAWAANTIAPVVPGSSFDVASRVPRDETFDAVVCFEVLEHVADPKRLLEDLKAAASPGAPVFLSTPNGCLSAGRPAWFMSPFHLAEYSARELAALIGATFGDSGEYLRQYRFDRLDCLPQALRARLSSAAPDRSTPARPEAGATAASLQRAHALFRRVPSPALLWRHSALHRPFRDELGYSHLLWEGRRTPE